MSGAVRVFSGSLDSANRSKIPVNLKYDTIISLVCEEEPSQPLSYGESDWLGCFQIAI